MNLTVLREITLNLIRMEPAENATPKSARSTANGFYVSYAPPDFLLKTLLNL